MISRGSHPTTAAAPAAVAVTTARVGAARTWGIAVVLSIALAVAGFFAGQSRRPAQTAEPIQFTITPPPNTSFAPVTGGGTGLAPQVAVSPDGRLVAFVGSGQGGYQLWLRTISGLDARAVAGTAEAMFPFWSPDSRYIGFFANGKLKESARGRGPPIVLCDVVGGRGGTWNRDNVILFAGSSTLLQRVSADGGVPQNASTHDKAYSETSHHRFPSFLPDGRHFVYNDVVGARCPAPKQDASASARWTARMPRRCWRWSRRRLSRRATCSSTGQGRSWRSPLMRHRCGSRATRSLSLSTSE